MKASVVVASCSRMSASIVPYERSIVDRNNYALSFFLRRDFDQAKEHLQKAYDLCLRKLQACPPSTVSFQLNLVAPTAEARIDADSEVSEQETTIMIDEDIGQEQTPASYHDKQPCHGHVHTIPSLDAQRTHIRQENDVNGSHQDTAVGASLRVQNRSDTGIAVYTMYNRALVLSSPEDDDPQMLVRTRAVLLYNMALVHHNIGIHHGVLSSLWEALRLYELALDTLDRHIPRECGPNGSMSNTALCFMWRMLNVEKLLLAILNNMGNIHAYLLHLENTRACMESLRIVLEASAAVSSMLQQAGNDGFADMNMTGRNETPVDVPAMSEDYIFFLLNSLFQGKELILAAAA
jgi:tetratricopeptide (TPR) repeat protein